MTEKKKENRGKTNNKMKLVWGLIMLVAVVAGQTVTPFFFSQRIVDAAGCTGKTIVRICKKKKKKKTKRNSLFPSFTYAKVFITI